MRRRSGECLEGALEGALAGGELGGARDGKGQMQNGSLRGIRVRWGQSMESAATVRVVVLCSRRGSASGGAELCRDGRRGSGRGRGIKVLAKLV